MPKGPAPAREAALDALYDFCRNFQKVIEKSSRHVLRAKSAGPTGEPVPARADTLLHRAVSQRRLDGRDAGLATEIFYGSLRHLIGIDHALRGFLRVPKSGVDLGVLCILRVAAYQLMHLDRTPPYAVVDDAVEQAKSRHGRPAAGFVNGVLRSMMRGITGINPSADPRIRYSFPDWLSERWTGRYGPEGASSLMEAMDEVPPLTLRVNLSRTTRDAFMETLGAADIEAGPGLYAPEAVRVTGGTGWADVASLPGYAEGLFAVQDEAAMLVSHLFGPTGGGVFLDACAAPGGKATHIAELSGGATVAAADIALDKLHVIKENVNRLRLRHVYAVGADSREMPFGRVFDGALIDAPCTGLGVIRRRPDIRYLRRPADIQTRAALQLVLLRSVAESVKPGGTLVYATCSTEPEEGEGVVEAFLTEGGEFVTENAAAYLPETAGGLVTPDGYMRTRPDLHDVDGFFAARLTRTEN